MHTDVHVEPDPAATPAWVDRTARALTEVLAPWVILVLLSLAVAWQATHQVLPAIGWGLLVALTSSLLPMAVIVWGARSGRWEGHHVRNREGRLVPFLVLQVLSAAGLVLLLVLGAPWPVVALDLTLLAMLFVTGGITIRWKVSLHASVSAGAVVVLALVAGPGWWLLSPLVVAVSWSRVRLRDHTTAQVVGGALVGLAAGSGVFAALL